MPHQESIRIRVLLFSVLRELMDAERIEVALPEPATSAHLLDRLSKTHPAFAPYRDAVRVAVNERYVGGETPLSTGDEVALITAVSGG